jgi:RNA polymerase sigma-70 factor (ECF subfamily)
MSYRLGEPPASKTGDALEEQTLVLQAMRGDDEAYTRLFERYNERISRYLVRMVGDDGVGCELAQETFLKAWQSLPGLRDPACFVSWLYRIATNRACTYQTSHRHSRTVSWDLAVEYASELYVAGPEQQVAEQELVRLVLAQITPTYRACVIFYIVEQLPQKQVAEMLGIKVSSVSKYVQRGQDEFRRIYAQLMQEGVKQVSQARRRKS